jgi:hypothetical protein
MRLGFRRVPMLRARNLGPSQEQRDQGGGDACGGDHEQGVR